MFLRAFFFMAAMSSILVHAQEKPPQNEETNGNHTKLLEKFLSKVESLPIIHHSEKEGKPKEDVPTVTEDINPAENFPDPVFYDAIYKKTYTKEVPLWLHNDKASAENNHIPPILNYHYVIDDLFKIIPYYEQTPDLLLVIEAIQDRDDIDLNKQDKFGNTLLHYAIRYHNKSVFEKLLATRKVNPNICNFSYICPIHLSIYKDDVYEINRLITYGADLHFSNDRFEMPIITAIKAHHMSSVYVIAERQKERGISGNEIDYIIFIAKQEGLESLAKDLYLFFMLGQQFEH